ncbi:MAG: FAD-containing monooxygenase EthA [Humibacillus sp.]|nr:FAD-containing monooxygenase EthA [Humibacillus sp.]
MIEHLDVIVVGAGLSGIDAAYRLQTEAPSRRYTILEARDTLGGTWDLFRYPGVRSDSDMMTLGFPFEPWTDPDAIADGDKILDYLRSTARTYGIDERIRFAHKVVGASWSTPDARWTVTVEHDGTTERLSCSFLHLCSGYYDYDRPHDARLPGIDAFEGPVVHPQFWPDDLEVAGRRVVVVGSGATAVSLVPALVDRGAEVTMLQRTPTWITSLPRRDKARDLVQRVLPAGAGGAVARYKSVLGSMGFYELTRRRPSFARSLLTKGATRALGSPEMVADHFTPTYDPWDQRLCLVPDGDLFAALRSGHADVVTGAIDTITADGVRLKDGRELAADVIVTATGLRIKVAGGIDLVVDGRRRPTGELTVYRGLMFDGVPNLALCIGYVNASWTLRADLVSRYVCRLLGHMDQHAWRVAVPTTPPRGSGRPLLPITSGYVQRAEAELPRQGDAAPWLMRQNYLLDRRDMLHGDVTEAMAFAR